MKRPLLALLFLSLAAQGASAQQAAPAPAAGDPVAGAVVFMQCGMCHEVGPTAKNAQGPVLNGIIGRVAGTYPGYAYSPQNQNARVKWDVPTLTRYLKDPKGYIPGTKMFFKGLSSPKDIADVIAYLAQYDAQGNTKS
jgi:cytochrome c